MVEPAEKSQPQAASEICHVNRTGVSDGSNVEFAEAKEDEKRLIAEREAFGDCLRADLPEAIQKDFVVTHSLRV